MSIKHYTTMTSQVHIFGCTFDRLSMSEAVECVFQLIGSRPNSCQYVVTPNVQHVVMLEHHEGLRRAYQDAALVLADGMPVILASKILGRGLPQRVAGSDMIPELFASASKYGGMRVYLLGAEPGVALRAAENIMTRWPAVKIVGTYSPPFGFEKDAAENQAILQRIATCQPDVVVVGLGAPKQELWVHAHRPELRASVALCAGATIDFLAGHKNRAPRWMQKSGLEWVHRVATEPRRLLGRYMHDAWHFPRLVGREWLRDCGLEVRRSR